MHVTPCTVLASPLYSSPYFAIASSLKLIGKMAMLKNFCVWDSQSELHVWYIKILWYMCTCSCLEGGPSIYGVGQ